MAESSETEMIEIKGKKFDGVFLTDVDDGPDVWAVGIAVAWVLLGTGFGIAVSNPGEWRGSPFLVASIIFAALSAWGWWKTR